MEAYVLIHAEADGESLARKLRTIPGIVSAEDTSGAYDAIALARSGSTRHLLGGIIPDILKLPGVMRALPAPLVSSSGPDRESVDRDSGSRVEAA